MTKILFVCHGNICRSVGAQYVLQHMLEKERMAGWVEVDSAATSTEEIGNPIYPPMKKTLESHGIVCSGHRARQLRRKDYEAYDLLIAFDEENLYFIRRICGSDPEGKIHLLMDYTSKPGAEIEDPWYTRDFEQAYQDIVLGCRGLLQQLK